MTTLKNPHEMATFSRKTVTKHRRGMHDIVLSGSGPKYPAFLGGLKVLIEGYGVEVGSMCTVSGGSIVGAFIQQGMPIQDVLNIASSINPADHLDSNIASIGVVTWPFKTDGVYAGDKILKLLRKLLPKTLGDLKKPMHIVTYNLEKGVHVIWGNRILSHPNAVYAPWMDLPLCVRASMSLPLIFNPVMLKDPGLYIGRDQFDMHIDGGVGNNFPVSVFGNHDRVIGMRFQAQTVERKINNKIDMIAATIDGFIESTMREHMSDASHARQIQISTPNVGMDFNITLPVFNSLVEAGARSVGAWAKETWGGV